MPTEVIKRPVIPPHHLEMICKLVAETTGGLTGSEIGKIILDTNLSDVSPEMTKWKRLYNAFIDSQNRFQCSNRVLNFLTSTMSPSRYLAQKEVFYKRLHELNKILSFIGIEMLENAKFKIVEQASTISEAESRASHFKYMLENRNVHPQIYSYCNAELLVENYFHSVFEAVKSIADRIRRMTGLYADGAALVDTAFATNNPLLRINLMQTDIHRSEHLGLSNIIKGLFGLIRNPTAHTPKISFEINEEEALDIMIVVSLVHKKLDKVV